MRAHWIVGLLLVSAVTLHAQSYILKSVVVDGGGTRLASSGYACGLSVGQPVASFWLGGSGYRAMLGFWPHPYGGSVPGVEENSAGFQPSPLMFSLGQISPNPFNRRAAIRYSLPKESNVALRVYNSAGRAVTTLVRGTQKPGRYVVSWDVSGVPAAKLPCGTYFCRLEAGEYTATRKMVKTD